jgi:hypothetical protein
MAFDMKRDPLAAGDGESTPDPRKICVANRQKIYAFWHREQHAPTV